MPVTRDLTETLLAAWRTNHQVTVFLVSRVPMAFRFRPPWTAGLWQWTKRAVE